MGILDTIGLRKQPDMSDIMPPPQQIIGEQYMDPLAAAQLSRAYEVDNGAVGVAMITVDNKRIIDEFKNRLQGYTLRPRINVETGEVNGYDKDRFGDPVMNEEGINHLCGLFEFTLNKAIMLSNIPTKDEKWIKNNCRVFWRTIALQLAVNAEKWNVDRSRRDSIPYEMANQLYFTIMRAYDDGERRKLYPGQRNITTTMINPAATQEKRPIIGF